MELLDTFIAGVRSACASFPDARRGDVRYSMFAAMNLLAFAIHTVCDCLEQLWIDARTAKRARTRFFEHIRTITAYLVFPDWATLMQTLIDPKPPPNIEAQITK